MNRPTVNGKWATGGGFSGAIAALSAFVELKLNGDLFAWTGVLAWDCLQLCIAAFLGLGGVVGVARNQPVPLAPQAPVSDPGQQSQSTATVAAPTSSATVIAAPEPSGISPALKNWFTDAELDCKCIDLPDCDYRGIDPVTLRIANELRNEFGPLFVNSAYRCPSHNKAIGGATNSYHVKGKAMDLRSPTATPAEMYAWFEMRYPRQYGCGQYLTFIHIDCRTDSWARKAGPDRPWQAFEHKAADIQLS